jgi:uncharacterized protein (TIGR03437 family)
LRDVAADDFRGRIRKGDLVMKKYLPSGFVSPPILFLFASCIASAQSISIVSGNGQAICSQCPTRSFVFDPLVVVVKDARGTPIANATVTWTVKNLAGADGRITLATTTTGADGASSNTFSMQSPLTLLTPFVQANVTASAMGASVTFIETDGAVAPGTGIAQISSNLQSPVPGTLLTGDPGATSSIPVRVTVSSFFPSGPVPGVSVQVVADPAFPATAACNSAVLTDSTGTGVCNLQFGNTQGQGKIRIFIGGNYDVFGPFTIQVGSGSGNPANPGNPGNPGVPTPSPLTVKPSSLSFQYPGTLTQNVSVSSSGASVTYSAAVQVSLAQVTWLTVGAPTGPASPTAASSFPVTINPQGLSGGTYRATIAVHSGNGAADVIVPVQLDLQGSGPPGPPTGNPFNPGTPGTPGNPGTPSSPGQLSAAPSSLSFQYPGSTPQTVTINSSGSAAKYTATVQAGNAQATWLAVGQPTGPAAAGAPSSFQVSIVTQGSQPGTYNANVLVHPDNGTPDVTIPVQLTVQPPVVVPSSLSVAPSVINLSALPGAGVIPAGVISVTAVGPALSFTVSTSSANWLSIFPGGGSTPSQLAVSANVSGLQPGNYTGMILISASGASNGPQAAVVNLTVQTSQSLTLSTNSLVFASQFDDPAPPPQFLSASASNGALAFTAAASVNWLVVSPGNGSAGNPGTSVVISVDPAGLAPGTYAGVITFNSGAAANGPQAVAVTYVVSPRPTPVPNIISNAASGVPGAVAPGEIISIFGTSLGPTESVASAQSGDCVEKELAQTKVTFDNIPAPLLFVSDTEIKTIVPYGVAGRATTQMKVTYRKTASDPVTLNVTGSAPGIFTNDSGHAVVQNEDGGANAPDAPAAVGSAIVLFATGEGITNPLVSDGKILPADGSDSTTPVLQVAVTIGGVSAQLQEAGSVPGLVSGNLRVKVIVPDGAPSGDAVPMVLTIGSTDSPPAPISVQ